MQNENIEQAATQPEPSPALKSLKGKLKSAFTWKSLKGSAKAAFNNAREHKWEILGSGLVSFGIKWGALACTASVATSAIGIISLAATAGAASALTRHAIKISLAKKGEERDALRLSNKDLLKKVALGATFGAAGSAFGQILAVGYSNLNHECFSKFSTWKDMFITSNKADVLADLGNHANTPDAVSILQTPPPVAETMVNPQLDVTVPDATVITTPIPETPVITEVPVAPSVPEATISAPLQPEAPAVIATVPAAPASPLDAVKEYAANNKISARLKDALLRAESTSAHVRAQALDDIGVYAPKELQVQAYELLKQSAGMGNLKAQADIISIEFYGNKTLGIKADPEAAIDKMVELAKRSKVAAKLVKQWVGDPSGPVAPAAVPGAMPHHVIPASPVPKMVDVTATPVTSPAHVIPSAPTPKMVDVTNLHMAETAVPAPSLNAPEPDCIVKFDIHRPKTMIMDCADNGAEIGKVGDVINVVRPPILNIVMPPRP